MDRLKGFFDSTMFSPHGICLLWDPELLAVHIVSDAVIALAYFSIPFALAYFVVKRRDVGFNWVFWAFAIFITACGFTHLLSIYTLWVPIYGIEGIVKAATALASIATAILLWPLMPRLLAVPSPADLEHARAMLEVEAQQRRHAEELLNHSQKMDAIGRLTGGVAHDFNNLLMIISGNLGTAKRALETWTDRSREKLVRAVENAGKAAERAATLTNGLLAFARKQPFALKVINVNSVVRSASHFIERSLGENVSLQLDLRDEVWLTETDPGQLEAALLNLVVNAKDALPDGGVVAIKTANFVVDAAQAEDPELPTGRHVAITIIDDGVGMDNATLERAFEPFFTTKEVGQGTGLGLSQVYGFAKQSGGAVRIESSRGNGTTVTIYLPATAPGLQYSMEQAAPTETDQIGGGECILLVEDDDELRGYLIESLQSLGYHILSASNAEEAAASFRANSRTIDLLLTDMVMPGDNGRTLARSLLRMKPSLKVLLMSGYPRDALKSERLEPGVEFLQKPIGQSRLASKLRQMLDGFEPADS